MKVHFSSFLDWPLFSASPIQMSKRGGAEKANHKAHLLCKSINSNSLPNKCFQFMQEKGGGLACLLYSLVLSKGFDE